MRTPVPESVTQQVRIEDEFRAEWSALRRREQARESPESEAFELTSFGVVEPSVHHAHTSQCSVIADGDTESRSQRLIPAIRGNLPSPNGRA